MDTRRIDDHKRSIEDLQDQRARIAVRELHTAELHALEARGQAEEREGEVLEVRPARGGGSYVLQKGKCGKDLCRCSKPMHGPYWCLFTKSSGKTKSKYIGKDKPREREAELIILPKVLQ